jgi:hypothetical protein
MPTVISGNDHHFFINGEKRIEKTSLGALCEKNCSKRI